MLVMQLEILAQIAHDSDCEPLRQFVRDELEAGSDGVTFDKGIKQGVNKLMEGV